MATDPNFTSIKDPIGATGLSVKDVHVAVQKKDKAIDSVGFLTRVDRSINDFDPLPKISEKNGIGTDSIPIGGKEYNRVEITAYDFNNRQTDNDASLHHLQGILRQMGSIPGSTFYTKDAKGNLTAYTAQAGGGFLANGQHWKPSDLNSLISGETHLLLLLDPAKQADLRVFNVFDQYLKNYTIPEPNDKYYPAKGVEDNWTYDAKPEPTPIQVAASMPSVPAATQAPAKSDAAHPHKTARVSRASHYQGEPPHSDSKDVHRTGNLSSYNPITNSRNVVRASFRDSGASPVPAGQNTYDNGGGRAVDPVILQKQAAAIESLKNEVAVTTDSNVGATIYDQANKTIKTVDLAGMDPYWAKVSAIYLEKLAGAIKIKDTKAIKSLTDTTKPTNQDGIAGESPKDLAVAAIRKDLYDHQVYAKTERPPTESSPQPNSTAGSPFEAIKPQIPATQGSVHAPA